MNRTADSAQRPTGRFQVANVDFGHLHLLQAEKDYRHLTLCGRDTTSWPWGHESRIEDWPRASWCGKCLAALEGQGREALSA